MDSSLSAAISIAFYGTAFAMVLYLVSVGLSVTMGLMGFVNLAHGIFAVAGGYFMTTLMTQAGVSFYLAVPAAVILVAALAVPLERFLYRPLYGADELDQVLMTFGLVLMSLAVGKYFWGPTPQPFFPPPALGGQVDFLGRSFPAYRTFLIGSGAALVTLLWLGLDCTRFGAQLRAAVDNRRMAQSLGINTSRLFTLSFALGSALAALGGALGADILAIDPGYALEHLVYFLIVVSVGGLGTIRGPFIAAMVLGISDTAFKYLLPEFGAFFIYALTMAVLLWKPRGLFGQV